uniref:Uncharacterized protein n=1 Tax=Lepeophtheirus salmonis TaxID=72036 RepID=A0A0K2VCC1_LEPSM
MMYFVHILLILSLSPSASGQHALPPTPQEKW